MKIILGGIVALALWQAVSRYAEYRLCINDRRHFPTNFEKHDAHLVSQFRKLHPLFPF